MTGRGKRMTMEGILGLCTGVTMYKTSRYIMNPVVLANGVSTQLGSFVLSLILAEKTAYHVTAELEAIYLLLFDKKGCSPDQNKEEE